VPGQTYSGTAVAFEGMTLPEIREPVAAGPGPASMRAAEQALVEVSRKLADVNAELEALEREYADAHEGEAAEMTRMYLRKLGEPGRVGAVMFQLAARALGDQAEYYTVAHRELAALPVTDSHDGNAATPQLVQERQQSAAHVANRYQENSNANLTTAFQAFTPLTLPTPDTAAVAPAGAPGWPGGGGAAVPGAPTATATAAPGGGGSPAAPPVPSAPLRSGPMDSAAPVSSPPAAPLSSASSVGAGTGRSTAARPASTSTSALAPTPVAGLGRPPQGATTPLPSGDRPLPRRAPVDLPPGVLSPSVPRGSGSPVVPRAPATRAPASTGTAVPSARPGEGGRAAAPRTGEPSTRLAPGERIRTADPLTEPARPGSAARNTSSHFPYVPAGVGGGRRGEPHPRPDWLVEDDPEGVWLADVPDHGPGVLRGDDGGGDRGGVGGTGPGM
jgi:hypothetical protein